MSLWPGEHCVLCDEYMGVTPRSNCATVDHFIPRWMGGKRHETNGWRICITCNNRKSGRLPNEKETMVFSAKKGYCIL